MYSQSCYRSTKQKQLSKLTHECFIENNVTDIKFIIREGQQGRQNKFAYLNFPIFMGHFHLKLLLHNL